MIKRGDILEGKYEILMLRNRGGMSKVWLAHDIHLDKRWAVKEIDKTSEVYKKTVDEEKTLREIEIMKKLDHPALPRIVDIMDREDVMYIVMDYIEGDNLLEIMSSGVIPEQETVVSWMLDVCDAMTYLHSLDPPIIYRDMKPSNVILTYDQRIKIVDFGISKYYKENAGDTQPLGTPGYASPEHRSMMTDVRSDVYTIGTTMYHLLTGVDPSKPPFVMKPIREINPDLSSGLEKIIIKATKNDPDERYQSASEIANALESYKSLEHEHISALEKKETFLRRGILTGAVLVAAGIFLTVLGTILSANSYQELINTTPGTAKAIENYETAIDIAPSKPEAYEKLLAEYTVDGEFTDEELNAYSAAYDKGQDKLSRNKENYSNINYLIGESILTYYTGTSDRSARAKLLQAEPFLKNVTEGESVKLAENYVFLAKFYRNYIMADSSLVVKGATRENLEELLKNCSDVVENLQNDNFTGRSRMKEIVYEVVLTSLTTEASDIHDAGLPKSEIEKVANAVLKDPECTKENKAFAKDTLSAAERAYNEKNSKEVVYEDAD